MYFARVMWLRRVPWAGFWSYDLSIPGDAVIHGGPLDAVMIGNAFVVWE